MYKQGKTKSEGRYETILGSFQILVSFFFFLHLPFVNEIPIWGLKDSPLKLALKAMCTGDYV